MSEAELPEVRSADGEMTDRADAVQIVGNDGTDLMSVLIGVVSMMTEPATSTPVSGTLNATGFSPVPFVPQLGRMIWMVAKGTYSGELRLARSIDGGATKQFIQCDANGGNPISAIYGGGDGVIGRAAMTLAETSARATYYVYFDRRSGSVQFELHQ